MFKAASSGNDMSAICGDNFPIMVRLTVEEFYDTIGMPGQGIQLEEGVKMAVALEKANVKLMPGHKLCEVNDDGVKLEGNEGIVVENVDAVVLSLGVKSVNPLETLAKNVCSNVTVIGDAKKSGRIYNATKSGLEAALAL